MVLKLSNGQVIDYSKLGDKTKENFKYIDERLSDAGYNEIQRLAILGNIKRESEGNPLAVSKSGKYHGLIQWDKNRYRIQSNNTQEELKRQTDLLIKELEKTGWSGMTWRDQTAKSNSFKQTTDLKQAVDMFTRHFVRPGNMESEISKRFNFAKLARSMDPEYDIETAKKVLPKEQIEAWEINPEKNHLPTGYTDEQNKYYYLKSTQHESYPESREFERTNPETIRAMSVYRNADDYVSKFSVYSPITSGTPKSLISFDPYNAENLVYRPMILKKQSGGNLIYWGLNKSTPEYKQEELDYRDFDFNEDKFPIESVVLYSPKEITEIQEEPTEQVIYTTPAPQSVVTQTTVEQPSPLIPKGIIEYKTDGMDIGNMKELIDLMRDEGISCRITSGNRPGALTKNGSPSHHGSGNALDITPIKGQTWDDLINQMKSSKRFIEYMREHNLGILDERSKQMQAKTGATGAHFHIGPDRNAILNFRYLIG